jgi:hypothetical protein
MLAEACANGFRRAICRGLHAPAGIARKHRP